MPWINPTASASNSEDTDQQRARPQEQNDGASDQAADDEEAKIETHTTFTQANVYDQKEENHYIDDEDNCYMNGRKIYADYFQVEDVAGYRMGPKFGKLTKFGQLRRRPLKYNPDVLHLALVWAKDDLFTGGESKGDRYITSEPQHQVEDQIS